MEGCRAPEILGLVAKCGRHPIRNEYSMLILTRLIASLLMISRVPLPLNPLRWLENLLPNRLRAFLLPCDKWSSQKSVDLSSVNFEFAREVGLPRYIFRHLLLALLQRVGSGDVRLRLPTGLKIVLPRPSTFGRDAFATNSDVDWGSEALFFSHLDASRDFIDVGANIGYYSVYAAPIVRQVFSFEPDPRNHTGLEVNAALSNNIAVQKSALSSEACEVLLDVSRNTCVSKVISASEAAAATVLKLRATTLDAFANENPKLRATGIKLDTEGHELAILRGGLKMIQRDQPLILTELMRWPAQGGEPAYRELSAFAESLSYQLFAFVPCARGFLLPGRYRFIALGSEALFSANATKMIFAVPARLCPAFEKKTRE